ncbi:MAG: cytochrome P450, partial [Actinomycetota bacterium]
MLDFNDPDFLQDPYPTLNRVREETAVFRQAKDKNGQEMWFLTRHDDIHRTLRERRLGRTFEHALSHDQVGVPPPPPDRKPFTDLERWSLLQLEPPEHTRIRSLLSREFTPQRVAGLQPRMITIIDDLLDNAEGDSFDLLADFAQPFSLLVMCELLGAPFEDRDRLLDWSHRIVKMYEMTTTQDQLASAIAASAEFTEWAKALIAERRRRPTDDLVSGLCFVETDDGRLTDEEIISTVVLLLNAGHEATVNTLGNGLTALLQHPDQWERLVARDVDLRRAPEELFRFDSPLQLFERWVLADEYEVAGQIIGQGEKIAMLFGSANRDPRKWENPDTFDIGRGDPTHITFGWGLHHCIGAPLARLEVSTVLDRLTTRFPNASLVSEPVRHPTFVIHGY